MANRLYNQFPRNLFCCWLIGGARIGEKQGQENDMHVLFFKGFIIALSVVMLGGAAITAANAGDGYRIMGTDELKSRLESNAP